MTPAAESQGGCGQHRGDTMAHVTQRTDRVSGDYFDTRAMDTLDGFEIAEPAAGTGIRLYELNDR